MGELRTYRGASYCLSAINEAQVSRDPATLTLTYLWDAQDSAQAPQQSSKPDVDHAQIRSAEDPPQVMGRYDEPQNGGRPEDPPDQHIHGTAPTPDIALRAGQDPPPQAPQQASSHIAPPQTAVRPAEDPIVWEASAYSVVHCHWTYLAPYGTAYAIADLERHVGEVIPITPGEPPVAVIAAFNLSPDCTQVTVTVSIPRNLIDQVHEMPPGAHFPPSFRL